MIYLDSAATSLLKPPSVARAASMAIRTMASPGRGGHSAAMRAADTVFACRAAAAALFHVPEPERVVFTMNATHALDIAIHSLVSPGDPVVISGYEHNSVTRPLYALGAQVRVAASPLFDPAAAVDAFRRALPGARAAVCTMVSNVFGYLLPVQEIAELCAAARVPLIVDASQAAGCVALDASALGAAFVAMPGHKGLLGPQGTGILLCFAQPEPLLYGGTGSQSMLQTMPEQLPDRLEAGTHNVPGIAGLLAGIRAGRGQYRPAGAKTFAESERAPAQGDTAGSVCITGRVLPDGGAVRSLPRYGLRDAGTGACAQRHCRARGAALCAGRAPHCGYARDRNGAPEPVAVYDGRGHCTHGTRVS